MNIIEVLEPWLADAISIRHAIHKQPELGFEENNTQALVVAETMIADGVLERLPIEECYVLHNMPGIPEGHFAFKEANWGQVLRFDTMQLTRESPYVTWYSAPANSTLNRSARFSP